MAVFSGPEEEKDALSWMRNRLDDYLSKTNKQSEQRDSAADLRTEINHRLKELPSNVWAEDEFHETIWERFLFAMSGKWSSEQLDWAPPYEFAEWDPQSPKNRRSVIRTISSRHIPRGGGSAKHFYSQRPGTIKWNLVPITQKGYTFYIGKAQVSEIDAVCSVPQLPREMDSVETAMRVLNKARGEKEWQRRVDSKRVLSIKKFISGPENLISNAAILYASEHDSVRVDADGTIHVDFNFLKTESTGEYCDHRGKRDLRPIWLIDGQHRTRGLAQSKEGALTEIPIILFPPSFSLCQSAKIFSEINTLQKKLSALHTLFMQHRFGIPSPVAKRDFVRPWDKGNGSSR